jgi:HSP20 family molecular chaperone IbpA
MDLERFGTAADLDELIAVRDRIESLVTRDVHVDNLTPKADLLDLGDALQLRIEVPGVDQGDIELALQGRDLLVAGLRETLEEGVETVFSERPNGPFQRTVDCPTDVERDHVSAHLRERRARGAPAEARGSRGGSAQVRVLARPSSASVEVDLEAWPPPRRSRPRRRSRGRSAAPAAHLVVAARADGRIAGEQRDAGLLVELEPVGAADAVVARHHHLALEGRRLGAHVEEQRPGRRLERHGAVVAAARERDRAVHARQVGVLLEPEARAGPRWSGPARASRVRRLVRRRPRGSRGDRRGAPGRSSMVSSSSPSGTRTIAMAEVRRVASMVVSTKPGGGPTKRLVRTPSSQLGLFRMLRAPSAPALAAPR